MRVKQYEIVLVSKPVGELLEKLMKHEEYTLTYSETIEDYAKLLVLYDYLPKNTKENNKYKTFKFRNQFFILRKEISGNITFFKIDETPDLFNEIRIEPNKK